MNQDPLWKIQLYKQSNPIQNMRNNLVVYICNFYMYR